MAFVISQADSLKGGFEVEKKRNSQSGITTLVGGTVTVTGVVLTSNSVIHLGRNTPAGTLGNLSTPSASRTGTQFVINSSSGTETSTIEWTILG